MKKIKLAAFLIAVFSVLGLTLSACNKTTGTTIATVGKKNITLSQLTERINSFPAQYKEALTKKENKVKILDQMIDETLLESAALRLKINKNDNFKTELKKAKQQLLLSYFVKEYIDNKIKVTEQDLQNYFKENQQFFQKLERRKARHILVKDEKKAKSIHRKLKKGAKFESLAKANSIDSTAQNGGLIDWFTKGQLVPEFEKAAFALKKGAISKVVKTQFGYHIIKLEDINVRPALTFEEVKSQIQQAVIAQKKQTKTQEILDQLKKDFTVTKDISNIK